MACLRHDLAVLFTSKCQEFEQPVVGCEFTCVCTEHWWRRCWPCRSSAHALELCATRDPAKHHSRSFHVPLWLVPLFALPGTRLSLTCPMSPPCATPRRLWCLTIALVVATMQMACQCCWALPLEAVPSTDPKYDHMLHMNSYSQLHFRANPADEWVLFKAVVAREAWCVSRGCAAFSCPRGGVPLRGTDVSVCTSSQGRRGDHACPDDWPSPQRRRHWPA